MTIVFKLLPDGAFVAGDTESKQTCYAFPSSSSATSARKSPERVAADMMKRESVLSDAMRDRVAVGYDARNWERLNA